MKLDNITLSHDRLRTSRCDRVWHSNKQLLWEGHYVNDQPHGVSKRWYSNGQLWWERHYVNGQRHGVSKRWYSNGELRWEYHYVNVKSII